MDDKKLIKDFLQKNFEPIIVKSGLLYTEKNPVTKTNPGQLSFLEIKMMLINIFNYPLDTKETVANILDEWNLETYKQVARKIDKYLDECSLVIGKKGFEVKNSSDVRISYKTIEESFISLYSKQFIKEIYNKWYVKKVNELLKEYESQF